MMEDAQHIGRYRLIRCISQSAMGRIWLARDDLLGREVALKEVLFRASLSAEESADLRRRTLREARAAAQLDHPNVVWVYDVVSVVDRPWIVMQYVPSRSLHRVLTDDGPLPVKSVARIGIELVEALRAAHRAGVLHRDVTPRNVLLAEDGRAMLAGFGSAAIEGAAAVSQSWGIGTSPQYVAPERVRTGVSSPEADLWALGATLYAAVEGRPPYGRTGLVETLLALSTDPPDQMHRAGPLKRVIEGLLEREVRRRPDAAQVARRLRKIAGTAPAPTRSFHLGVRPDAASTDAADATWVVPTSRPDDRTERLPDTGSGATTQVLPGAASPADQHDDTALLPATRADGRTGLRSAATLVAALVALAAAGGLTVVGAQRALGGLHGTVIGTSTDAGPDADTDTSAGADADADADADPGSDAGAAADGASPAATGSPAPLSAATSTVPAAACLTPSRAAARVVSSGRPTGGDRDALPPGWSWHVDEEDFHLAVPPGWWRFFDGDVICLADPRGDRFLAVDLAVSRRKIPSDHWRAEADRLTAAGALPGYTKISIGPLIRPGGAAEWEYTWDSPAGQRQHARRLLVNGTGPGKAYALTWVTPDAGWADGEAVYRVLSDSFRRSG
ncbi:hypothetical protein Jiend_30970 [Micromonospora endophytica]|nr:hypothetical protein Jiend_30970 [Micromonospora endophytica]